MAGRRVIPTPPQVANINSCLCYQEPLSNARSRASSHQGSQYPVELTHQELQLTLLFPRVDLLY